MYESITKYLPKLATDSIGEWHFDAENDGSEERTFVAPAVDYSPIIYGLIEDAHKFVYEHPELGLDNYKAVLKEYGIEYGWGSKSMAEADVDKLDGRCVIALIFGIIRAERFCEGTILSYIKRGIMAKWLKRLEELDGEGANQ